MRPGLASLTALGIAAGGALFGFVGTFFAVPFLAVTLNAMSEARTGAPTVAAAEPASPLVSSSPDLK